MSTVTDPLPSIPTGHDITISSAILSLLSMASKNENSEFTTTKPSKFKGKFLKEVKEL